MGYKALWQVVIFVLLFSGATMAEPVVLEYWFGEVSDYSAAAMQDIVDRFNAENPDIYVDFVHKGNSNHMYKEALQVAIIGGVAPDVAYLNYYDIRDFSLQADWFVPFNELFSEEMIAQLNASYLPPAKDSVKVGDTWYGLPWRMDTRGLYYNADMFESAGLNRDNPPRYMDELDEYAGKLTVREGDKVVQLGFYPRGNNFSRELPWLWAFGGDFFDYDTLLPAFLGPNRQQNLEGVEWIESYSKTYGSYTEVPAGRFLQAQLGMIVQSTSVLPQYRDNANFSWGIGVLPTKRGVDLFSTTFPLGPAIPLGARHPQEAARFIEYLSNPDLQVEWYEKTAMPPPTFEAIRQIIPLTEDPRGTFLIQTMLPVSRVMPPLAVDILDIFQPKADRMRRGEISAVTVLEETQSELEVYFREVFK